MHTGGPLPSASWSVGGSGSGVRGLVYRDVAERFYEARLSAFSTPSAQRFATATDAKLDTTVDDKLTLSSQWRCQPRAECSLVLSVNL